MLDASDINLIIVIYYLCSLFIPEGHYEIIKFNFYRSDAKYIHYGNCTK